MYLILGLHFSALKNGLHKILKKKKENSYIYIYIEIILHFYKKKFFSDGDYPFLFQLIEETQNCEEKQQQVISFH